MLQALLVPSGATGRAELDETEERAFLVQYRAGALSGVRLAGAAGGFAYLAFFLVARFTEPHEVSALLLRLGLAALLFGVALVYHFKPQSAQQHYLLLAGGASALALGGVVYLLFLGPHGSRSLQSGASPALIFGLFLHYAFLRLPLWCAAGIGWSVSIAFLLGASPMVVGGNAELRTLIYVVFSNFVGMIVCHHYEARERALYFERRRAESAEAAARERARAAEDAHAEKTRLLAAVSHDLRQPIMAASTHLSVLRSKLGKGDLAMAREQLGHVRESVSMLGSTLDQLLTASRYDSGNEPIRIEAVEIGAVLEQLQRTFHPEAERKGLELRVRLPKQRVVVTSDATALWRVLMNLVSNAIKFTESEGRPGRGVVVKARVLGGVCRIDVVDTGVGISGEHMDAVWQPYFQVHNAERNRARGLGLGLFLVKRALDQLPTHELRVRSSPGRGSRFTLLLPGVHLSEPGVVVRHALALGPDALGQLRGAYVLLLEDDREARRAIEDLLDDWGVIHASGASLEELIPEVEASARTPDALVTDFRLPGQLTGAACVQELRRLIGETVPAVIVTGESDLAAVRAVMPPDTALLQKPFEETAFAQPLLEAVARARRAESEQIDR